MFIRRWYLPPRLTTGVRSPEPTWPKKATDSPKFFLASRCKIPYQRCIHMYNTQHNMYQIHHAYHTDHTQHHKDTNNGIILSPTTYLLHHLYLSHTIACHIYQKHSNPTTTLPHTFSTSPQTQTTHLSICITHTDGSGIGLIQTQPNLQEVS